MNIDNNEIECNEKEEEILLKEQELKEYEKKLAFREKLLKSRTIFISGEINQALAEKVSTQLLILEAMSDEPIKIFRKSRRKGNLSSIKD